MQTLRERALQAYADKCAHDQADHDAYLRRWTFHLTCALRELFQDPTFVPDVSVVTLSRHEDGVNFRELHESECGEYEVVCCKLDGLYLSYLPLKDGLNEEAGCATAVCLMAEHYRHTADVRISRILRTLADLGEFLNDYYEEEEEEAGEELSLAA